jgi:hypothetical protein
VVDVVVDVVVCVADVEDVVEVVVDVEGADTVAA